MTVHSLTAKTPRERFMEQAQKELAAFERHEREFRKQLRNERAAELRVPMEMLDFH
jgi:hypothetical protein